MPFLKTSFESLAPILTTLGHHHQDDLLEVEGLCCRGVGGECCVRLGVSVLNF